MGNTIADRLRDYALAPLGTNPWEFFHIDDECGSFHRYLADEIEREYILRLCLDGMPVKEGDMVVNIHDGTPGKVRGVAVIDGKPSVLIERQGWYGEDEIELEDSYQAIAEWAREWANADPKTASTGNLRGALLEVNNRLTALIERGA